MFSNHIIYNDFNFDGPFDPNKTKPAMKKIKTINIPARSIPDIITNHPYIAGPIKDVDFPANI